MIIKLKKFGQVTRVTVDDRIIYDTAVTPKYEKDHIEKLLVVLDIQDVDVEIEEKE